MLYLAERLNVSKILSFEVTTMVIYPKTCIGCGETDPQKLKEFGYTFKHRHAIGSRAVGYNTIETTYDVHTLHVGAFLCEPCERTAKARFIGGFILLLILMLASWIGMGVAGDYGDYELQTALIPVSVGFLIAFCLWVGWRRHPETHFHKVRYNYRRGSFRFIFKNQRFAEIFKQANPGEQIEIKHGFP